MPLSPRGDLRSIVQFLGATKDPFEQFQRAQVIRHRNDGAREKNREKIDANVAPGNRLRFLTQASKP